MEFCTERGLCVGTIYFKYKCLHKYTRVARHLGGVEVKSLIDLVLVKKGMLLSAGWKGRESNGTRPLRSLCCTV